MGTNNFSPFNAQHFDNFHSNNFLASEHGQQYVASIPIPHIKAALQQHIEKHNQTMSGFNTTLNDEQPTMGDLLKTQYGISSPKAPETPPTPTNPA